MKKCAKKVGTRSIVVIYIINLLFVYILAMAGQTAEPKRRNFVEKTRGYPWVHSTSRLSLLDLKILPQSWKLKNVISLIPIWRLNFSQKCFNLIGLKLQLWKLQLFREQIQNDYNI